MIDGDRPMICQCLPFFRNPFPNGSVLQINHQFMYLLNTGNNSNSHMSYTLTGSSGVLGEMWS